MADEAYDLRSNIKGKPGSQGTLFQVKDKGLLNPAQRWPRGYTPERQAEVRGALSDVPVTSSRIRNVEGLGGVTRSREARARVEDTVARSTIPTEHLSGLTRVHDRPQQGHAATYWPGTHEVGIDMLSGKDKVDRSLVHELGHHYDTTDPNQNMAVRKQVQDAGAAMATKEWEKRPPLSRGTGPTGTARIMAEGNVSGGVKEATADNYMVEHYRTRGRNPEPVTSGRYEDNWAPHEREQRFPGYNDVRPPQHMGPQFTHTNEALPGMDAASMKTRADANRWAVGEHK